MVLHRTFPWTCHEELWAERVGLHLSKAEELGSLCSWNEALRMGPNSWTVLSIHTTHSVWYQKFKCAQNKEEDSHFLVSKLTLITKTVWCTCKDRHTEQCNKPESPDYRVLHLQPSDFQREWQDEVMEKEVSFQQMVLAGTIRSPHAKEWSWTPYLTPHTKMNSEWVRLKCKSQSCKTPRRKHRRTQWCWSKWWFLRLGT